ncbi:MAG: cyclic nucleotide-binding domain-containing protein [Oscillatoriales cyanobacterium RM1_1_9]|nr:cyclic nucleotide-binding domain-containing protein [Oscillatoriales cyanobacterium SM2_3_0]NJO46934.1 cyclic nucleotide-binding domain-containing protein [Oscillatoriales cyanobacterium RM2_1_1]NJO70965.1 cyclic nucleotide-binding domain-containing protein [Oscillatoriales cyanobacterium RM1_1_9]
MSQQTKNALFILGGLDDSDLQWVINRGKVRTLLPDETLIYEGRPINALYIVLNGLLRVSIFPSGEKELAMLPQGEVVGEISFIDSRPPLATVKAVDRSQVLAIPRYELNAQLHRNAGFSSRFYQGISLCLASRMRGTIRRLGYQVEDDDLDVEAEGIDQTVKDFLTVAEAKFNWLIQNLDLTSDYL